MDVKTLCLAVLAHGEASGYDVKKALEEGAYAHFYRASYGSIYPALARLAEAGLVTAREEEQANRPDRRVYALSPAGRQELARALNSEPVGPDYVRSPFVLSLFHAGLLRPERLKSLIDQRLAWLEEWVAKLEAAEQQDPECRRYAGAGPLFVCDYGLACYRAELDFLTRNRHRLEASAAANAA